MDTQKYFRNISDLYSYVRLIRCVAEEISDEPDWMASLGGEVSREKRTFGKRHIWISVGLDRRYAAECVTRFFLDLT